MLLILSFLFHIRYCTRHRHIFLFRQSIFLNDFLETTLIYQNVHVSYVIIRPWNEKYELCYSFHQRLVLVSIIYHKDLKLSLFYGWWVCFSLQTFIDEHAIESNTKKKMCRKSAHFRPSSFLVNVNFFYCQETSGVRTRFLFLLLKLEIVVKYRWRPYLGASNNPIWMKSHW